MPFRLRLGSPAGMATICLVPIALSRLTTRLPCNLFRAWRRYDFFSLAHHELSVRVQPLLRDARVRRDRRGDAR